ncbi:LysR family transcriptional regulator [Pseudomonas sp. CCM 7891]|uniref:LysR family transcriptional regulator n=1 Tax=Pseudomonas karstica TaxID=1055468 RepID=A0A7X2V0L9_9PSED|nr:LysR family transcriptional regulator [Pseudomonas karstica]MTD21417.1 LysR family transcriptional regulator [Pseudomonas karstica]
MDLRDLYYFETIAELGNLGRAGEKLHRTQPALSKSIQRLEENLGTALFLREGRRMRLTPAGELLLMRARHLRQGVQETRREIQDFAKGIVGNVRLGCGPTAAEYLLPSLVSLLLDTVPELTLELVTGQNDILLNALRTGQLDLLICPLSAVDVAQFETFALLQDEVVVVASADHVLFEQDICMADLCAWRWVLAAPTVATRRWLDNAFFNHRLDPPRTQIQTNSINMMPRLIAHTPLLSFISRHNLGVGKIGATLREVPLPETTMRRSFGVVMRREAYVSPPTVFVVELLKREGAALFSDHADPS